MNLSNSDVAEALLVPLTEPLFEVAVLVPTEIIDGRLVQSSQNYDEVARVANNHEESV